MLAMPAVCLDPAGDRYHNSLKFAWASERPIVYLKRIISRVGQISSWTNTDMHIQHPEDRRFKQRRHSGISAAEMTAVRVLQKRLADLRTQFNLGYVNLGDELSRGRNCSAREALRQVKYYELEKPSVCAELQAYKFAHMAWPEASVFVDIGMGRGYFSALVMSLWAGGGYGVSPFSVLLAFQENELLKSDANIAGYCKSGLNRGYPLLCREEARQEDGKCLEKHPEVRLYSVDSSSDKVRLLQEKIADRLNQEFGDEKIQIKQAWDITHARLSNSMNTQKDSTRTVTLFDFSAEKGIVNDIDVLRIDTGRNSYQLVRDSYRLIDESSVGLLAFDLPESDTQDDIVGIVEELSKRQFDCYVPYFIGLIKLSGGCWPDSTNIKNGKVVCASRMHAPSIVLVYDALMLGHLDNYYWPY